MNHTEFVFFPPHISQHKRETILECARITRKWANTYFGIYEARRDLCGLCATASSRLWTLLQKKGVPSKLHMVDVNNYCHVFVVCEGMIIDVTATQFGEDDICIVEHKSRAEWFWKSSTAFHTPQDLRDNQISTGWVVSQVAALFNDHEV